MSDKSDSSLARLLAVLDLFDEQHLQHTAESVAEALQVSLPTAYRYVRLLTDAGLLQRTDDARLTLGPRVIALDHLIRRSDRVLQHGLPFMKELVADTGLDCVATALYGHQVLDIHREYSALPASLSYGRGRPRPMFLGAAPKVLVAAMPPAAMKRLMEARASDVQAAGLPADWPSFRRYFAGVRKTGYYHSHGELEPNLAAVAVPVQQADGRVTAALSLVTTTQRMTVIDVPKLAEMLRRASADIVARMQAPG